MVNFTNKVNNGMMAVTLSVSVRMLRLDTTDVNQGNTCQLLINL